MINYFYLIFVVSFFSLGLRAITDSGMIAYPVRRLFQRRFPVVGKPIVLCATCMSSVWGTIIFWGYVYFQEVPIDFELYFVWIGIAISASFINALSWRLYENINRE
tara:strand:- start:133 stop:450 length:318 start_codon:yes stop_codon:yes gene_type:complete